MRTGKAGKWVFPVDYGRRKRCTGSEGGWEKWAECGGCGTVAEQQGKGSANRGGDAGVFAVVEVVAVAELRCLWWWPQEVALVVCFETGE